jgi:hypothetical protein
MPKKPIKPKSARSKQKAVATKPETGTAAPKESEAKKGQSTFLLRLPPELRSALESLRDESGSKSLQNLILQLLAEGLARKADFRVSELFARDLHVKTLAATVGPAPDLIVGNRRVELEGNTFSNFVVDQPALLDAHQRVLQELENQKLSSFASIMDPALLSYRLLVDFASQISDSRDSNSLLRDFSNGLKLSALQAMVRGKWSFAELLLLHAAAADPTNLEVSHEAGIYLLRRLVRRWQRPEESLTPGVTNSALITVLYPHERRSLNSSQGREPTSVQDEEVDETAWATAMKAWNLLVHDDRPEFAHLPWYTRGSLDPAQASARGNWRIELWKRLATIIVCTASPDQDDWNVLAGSNFHRPELAERNLIPEIVGLFGTWEKGFRMTREVSRLQREWTDWFEPLEVLWWLGYRKEAHALALEARGFLAERPVMDRMADIRRWTPNFENSEPSGYDEDDEPTGFTQVIYVSNESGDHEMLGLPEPLCGRPMSA